MTAPTRIDEGILGALAERTHTPIERVKVLYDEEVAHLRSHSAVTKFISVIAGRRVKERLMAPRR